MLTDTCGSYLAFCNLDIFLVETVLFVRFETIHWPEAGRVLLRFFSQIGTRPCKAIVFSMYKRGIDIARSIDDPTTVRNEQSL